MENRISINGIEYERVKPTEELPYVIARTHSAGVFAGYLKERNGKEGTLVNARRIWYWEGAASLSQLAMEGTSKPANCRFPIAVEQVVLTEIIELLNVTDAGKKSIEEVPIWKK
jgi:hypothetical protein